MGKRELHDDVVPLRERATQPRGLEVQTLSELLNLYVLALCREPSGQACGHRRQLTERRRNPAELRQTSLELVASQELE